MAKQLTKRQHTVLETIRAWIRDRGYPPTIRELRQQLGIKSLRGVTSHLDAIAKKGFLTRESRARSIRLRDAVAPFERAIRIPVVGHVRAGEPVLAEQHIEDHLVVDSTLIGSKSPDTSVHFALKVHGDSMVNAGIYDGDHVIVRQQPTAVNGEIVVALLDDEATVKRFYQEGTQVRLQPDHPTMEPIMVANSKMLSILGKVVAVFRRIG